MGRPYWSTTLPWPRSHRQDGKLSSHVSPAATLSTPPYGLVFDGEQVVIGEVKGCGVDHAANTTVWPAKRAEKSDGLRIQFLEGKTAFRTIQREGERQAEAQRPPAPANYTGRICACQPCFQIPAQEIIDVKTGSGKLT